MNTICIILLLTILSILYTLVTKQYISTKKKRCLVYIILLEITACFYYIKILENNNIGPIFAILTCLSILIMTILSILIFKECITTNIILGIICSIIAIVLLSIE